MQSAQLFYTSETFLIIFIWSSGKAWCGSRDLEPQCWRSRLSSSSSSPLYGANLHRREIAVRRKLSAISPLNWMASTTWNETAEMLRMRFVLTAVFTPSKSNPLPCIMIPILTLILQGGRTTEQWVLLQICHLRSRDHWWGMWGSSSIHDSISRIYLKSRGQDWGSQRGHQRSQREAWQSNWECQHC